MRGRDLLPQLGGKASRIDREDLLGDGRLLCPCRSSRRSSGSRARSPRAESPPRSAGRRRIRASPWSASCPGWPCRRSARCPARRPRSCRPCSARRWRAPDRRRLRLRLDLVRRVERGDHPVRHGRAGIARVGRVDIAHRLAIGGRVVRRSAACAGRRDPSRRQAPRAPAARPASASTSPRSLEVSRRLPCRTGRQEQTSFPAERKAA